ncbi:MAG: aminotransferase class I/II-fold pyridoxal phosphate-dependent enzyme [Flavobacteriaceae bacterium]|nr:aminotransferase class I/II-fold pyridoxal phosphate-dependent enzyme [Flavobacteriaceae bacterium]
MTHESKLPNIETTIFAVMSGLANKYGALNLSQGYPNFKGDQKLYDLVNAAMNSGYNQYAHMYGSQDLRLAIKNKVELLYKTTYDPETEITVTVGATQAIYTTISTFIKKGDEVIVFRPAYDSYIPSIQINRGIPVSIQLLKPDFRIDWEDVKQKINSKTKMIIINSPHNPSGTMLTKDDMLKLQELTKNTNIVVLSDEVYEHLVFDNEQHLSACMFPDLKSRSFVISSLGKTFHNTGWKIGYCCAPKHLMDEFIKLHQFTVFSVNHPTQKGIADYMQEPEHYLEIPQFFQRKRDLFLDAMKNSRFKFTPSKGTYFQLLDYSEITDENDFEFAKRLIVEHGVASIPTSVFNKNKLDQKVLRFCFAKTDETLIEATKILTKL